MPLSDRDVVVHCAPGSFLLALGASADAARVMPAADDYESVLRQAAALARERGGRVYLQLHDERGRVFGLPLLAPDL